MPVQRFEGLDVGEHAQRVDDLIVRPFGLDVAGIDESCRELMERIDPAEILEITWYLGEPAAVGSKELAERNDGVDVATDLMTASVSMRSRSPRSRPSTGLERWCRHM